MRNLLLLAAGVALAACRTVPERETDAGRKEPWEPRIGVIESVWEVLDEDTRTRLGFVDRTEYDDGRTVYWVRGADRGENLGFVLTTGRAYRYVWHGGTRAPEPEDLGADVLKVGARKILGHVEPVVLEATTLERIAAERARKPEPAPAGEAGSEDEEE